MFRYFDLVFGGLAWLCGMLFLLIPLSLGLGIYFYLPLAWPICIVIMLLLRRRPLKELWWVWLSGMLIYRWWAVLLLAFAGLMNLPGLIHSYRGTSILTRNNLDIMFGMLAWLCTLGIIFGLDLPLPGESLVYQAVYFPAAWVVFIAGLLLFRSHPWHKLWWIWLSLPVTIAPWLEFFYVVETINVRK